jgi:hypothetical protein
MKIGHFTYSDYHIFVPGTYDAEEVHTGGTGSNLSTAGIPFLAKLTFLGQHKWMKFYNVNTITDFLSSVAYIPSTDQIFALFHQGPAALID